VLVDDALRALDELALEKAEVGLSRKRLVLEVVSLILDRRKGLYLGATATPPAKKVLFPLEALISTFNASVFGLILQP